MTTFLAKPSNFIFHVDLLNLQEHLQHSDRINFQKLCFDSIYSTDRKNI